MVRSAAKPRVSNHQAEFQLISLRTMAAASLIALSLPKAICARHVFHAAIRCGDQPVRRDIFEAVADAVGDHVGGLDLGIAEIDHAQHDFLR